jgi:predicted enzyme related to lactoylglutathione lyase
LSDNPQAPAVGQIGWVDLTVPNADAVRDFYSHVTGWTSTGLSMGDYEDYCMNPPGTENPVAGVCHARGSNASQPPVWMIYIVVADLQESIRRCLERGGKVLSPERNAGAGKFCVIQDPAGAIAGLYQSL